MPNDPDWADEPGHEDDNRWAHRPRLDWTRAADRDDLRTVAGPGLPGPRAPRPGPGRAAAAARLGVDRVLSDTDDGVLAVVRAPRQRAAASALYNVTGERRPFPIGPAARRSASPRRTTPSAATT